MPYREKTIMTQSKQLTDLQATTAAHFKGRVSQKILTFKSLVLVVQDWLWYLAQIAKTRTVRQQIKSTVN